ncbi:sulfite oxidase [Sphaerisporangium aureirubrum]|uniref:Sulfite oxidase n=1 Tax=Sphaerisporangium aureirubrum TaxID=1544736 RepID=A0ABW1NDZ1_9ACTN
MRVHHAHPYNAEPPPAVLAEQVITPVDAFYVRDHAAVPAVDLGAWRLTVDGLVERELELSLADLRTGFPERTVVATLQCAGNRRAGLLGVRDIPGEDPWGPGATSTAVWSGTGLADVLTRAGLRAGAAHIAFQGCDVSMEVSPPQPYGGSVPLAKAVAPEVLLAWEMNGEPLPPVHGAPLRVVVPGWIGARSVKWLTRITALAEPSGNYYQAIAYRMLPAVPGPDPDGIPLGPVPLNSAILRPGDGDRLAPGPTEVAGYAYTGGGRAVARVEVSLDGGTTWQRADLGSPAGPWAWRHWRATARLPAGETTIAVRAWDDAAATQPESPRSVWNPKGYANTSWHRVTVTCRE